MIAQNRYAHYSITLLAGLVIAWSVYHTSQLYRVATSPAAQQSNEPGREYADLRSYLKDVRVIGYFTDRNFSSESAQMKYFLSAQYMLAPVILDVNNPRHPLMLIDCQSLILPFDIMQRLHAEMIYINNNGKILAGATP